jgi:hypothetical protein
VDAAARALVAGRFLLEEDAPRVRARLGAAWDWVAAQP